jgi:hypothetical protein
MRCIKCLKNYFRKNAVHKMPENYLRKNAVHKTAEKTSKGLKMPVTKVRQR